MQLHKYLLSANYNKTVGKKWNWGNDIAPAFIAWRGTVQIDIIFIYITYGKPGLK